MKSELIALCALSGLVLSGCKDDVVSSNASVISGERSIGTVIDTLVVENKYQTKVFYLIDTDLNKQDAEYVGYVDSHIGASQMVGQAYNAKKIGMQKTLGEWQNCLRGFERIYK